jgi:hypothetical protein
MAISRLQRIGTTLACVVISSVFGVAAWWSGAGALSIWLFAVLGVVAALFCLLAPESALRKVPLSW